MLETLSKMKIVGCFLALWGVALATRGIADLFYYVYNFGTSGFSESLAETVFYVIGDVAYIAAAVALWVISAKIMRAKNQLAA